MSSSISPAVILSLLLLFCNVNLIRADCLLCDGIRDDGMPENNWGYQLEDGRFCQDVFLKILDLDPWDDTCKKEQAFASEECCGPALATLQQQEEIVPEGNEPPCYLCFQPDIYPTKPGVLVVARYLGAFTCAEFFNRGLNGQVSQGMCGPLQDHALTACGCAEALSSETQADEPNPGNQGGSRPPPPTAAPVAPPTRAPVVPPSPAPVLPPTLAPVEMVAAVTPAPVAPITLSQPTDAPRRPTDAPMSQVSLTAAPVVALVASPAPVEANIPAVPAPTDAPVVDATSDTEESKPSKGDKKPEDDGDGEHAQKMSKKDGKGSERRQQRHKNRHRRQLRRSSN